MIQKCRSQLVSASNKKVDDVLEFVKIQMLQRMQEQDERNSVEAEEQRLHQE